MADDEFVFGEDITSIRPVNNGRMLSIHANGKHYRMGVDEFYKVINNMMFKVGGLKWGYTRLTIASDVCSTCGEISYFD